MAYSDINGKTAQSQQIAVTGALSIGTRQTVRTTINRAGARLVDNVNTTTDFLVVGTRPGGRKRMLAERYNIPIITEGELTELLGAQNRPLPSKNTETGEEKLAERTGPSLKVKFEGFFD